MNDEQLMSNIKKIYEIKKKYLIISEAIPKIQPKITNVIQFICTSKYHPIIAQTFNFMLKLINTTNIDDNLKKENPLLLTTLEKDSLNYLRITIIYIIINS